MKNIRPPVITATQTHLDTYYSPTYGILIRFLPYNSQGSNLSHEKQVAFLSNAENVKNQFYGM